MHKRKRKTFVIRLIQLEILKCYIVTMILCIRKGRAHFERQNREWE